MRLHLVFLIILAICVCGASCQLGTGSQNIGGVVVVILKGGDVAYARQVNYVIIKSTLLDSEGNFLEKVKAKSAAIYQDYSGKIGVNLSSPAISPELQVVKNSIEVMHSIDIKTFISDSLAGARKSAGSSTLFEGTTSLEGRFDVSVPPGQYYFYATGRAGLNECIWLQRFSTEQNAKNIEITETVGSHLAQ